jgi:putative mRNA 3-end processing factor
VPLPLLAVDERGLYCATGDFYIDPWRPVNRAVITHAHSDHARWGNSLYAAHRTSIPLLQHRLGSDTNVEGYDYGQGFVANGVRVTFYPAGHVLGSAQIRVEYRGEIWVVSGDYKVEADSTCQPFETVTCHTFITETTFGLPIYRWEPQADIFEDINRWWQANANNHRASVLYGYSLGKAQRLLSGLDPTIGPIYVHGAVFPITEIYRTVGVALPECHRVDPHDRTADYSRAMIVAPPSAQGSTWVGRFGEFSEAFASGWMDIRGVRRRRALDRGFALSDHVDWESLMQNIKDTGAERVLTTHGYAASVSRFLQETGIESSPLVTPFSGEPTDGSGEEGPESE